jgi:tRNA(Ile)-lysidine synthase
MKTEGTHKVWKNFQQSLNSIEYKETQHFLLAVSGGVDSMVMLDLFLKANVSFQVAHVNFQLRGEESDKDEELVRNICLQNKIPFHQYKAETQLFCELNKVGIQEGARIIRYKWFFELLNQQKLHYLATAHHLGDGIETFFINAMRGGGVRGLKGIELIDQTRKVFRPLIHLTKQELVDFSNLHEISYRVDSSNLKDDYLRNALRINVIPKLIEIEPAFETKMGLTLSNLQIDADYLMTKLDADVDAAIQKVGEFYHVVNWSKLHPRVLLHCIERFDFPSSMLNELKKSVQSGKVFEGKTHSILRNREALIISQNRFVKSQKIYFELEGLDDGNLENAGLLSMSLIDEMNTAERNLTTAFLDFDKLRWPLVIRTWQEGDYFVPFGMRGTKKVSDFLTDLKLSKWEKDDVTVLISGGELVWVVGYRISEKYKIDKKTKNILKIVTRQA